MTLGKKHLWTKVSLVKALVNWGPRVGVPAEHHVSGRVTVLAERALRLFPPAHLIMSGEFLPADRRHLAIPLAIPRAQNGACPSTAALAPAPRPQFEAVVHDNSPNSHPILMKHISF